MHNLRARIAGDAVRSDFRCPDCNGLYEVIYPWSQGWSAEKTASAEVRLPESGGIAPIYGRSAGHRRCRGPERGVAIPRAAAIVRDVERVVTLREGNTPLYEMPRSAELAGVDCCWPAPGNESDGLVQDTGMTAALSVAMEPRLPVGGLRVAGNTSAAMAAYAARAGLRCIVFIPEGKIAWGKLSQSMDYGAADGAVEDRLRTDA